MKILCIESDRILRKQMLEEIKIKQENSIPTNQYPPKLVIKAAKSIQIEPKPVFEETKTVTDEEKLELDSYSPTNIEYLDEVDDEQILDEVPIISEIIVESQFSEDSNNSETSDWLPVEIKNEKIRKKKWKSDKPHQCSYCGKIFKSPSNLKSHELTHNQIKKHECEVCKKMFLMKCDLTKHLQIHRNERAYKCNVCSKGFNKLQTMKEHIRLVHSGEKNYMCSICDIGFPLKHQLISHNRTHTGEKPYQV